MAKPIPATPTVYGKDAEIILDEMVNSTPDTPERIKMIKHADEIFAKIGEDLRMVKPKKQKTDVVVEPAVKKYKLHCYNSRGLLRAEIPRAVFLNMSKKYEDILRSISSGIWMTADDVYTQYLNVEKRLKFGRHRDRAQIQAALDELVYSDMVLTK